MAQVKEQTQGTCEQRATPYPDSACIRTIGSRVQLMWQVSNTHKRKLAQQRRRFLFLAHMLSVSFPIMVSADSRAAADAKRDTECYWVVTPLFSRPHQWKSLYSGSTAWRHVRSHLTGIQAGAFACHGWSCRLLHCPGSPCARTHARTNTHARTHARARAHT